MVNLNSDGKLSTSDKAGPHNTARSTALWKRHLAAAAVAAAGTLQSLQFTVHWP